MLICKHEGGIALVRQCPYPAMEGVKISFRLLLLSVLSVCVSKVFDLSKLLPGVRTDRQADDKCEKPFRVSDHLGD